MKRIPFDRIDGIVNGCVYQREANRASRGCLPGDGYDCIGCVSVPIEDHIGAGRSCPAQPTTDDQADHLAEYYHVHFCLLPFWLCGSVSLPALQRRSDIQRTSPPLLLPNAQRSLRCSSLRAVALLPAGLVNDRRLGAGGRQVISKG